MKAERFAGLIPVVMLCLLLAGTLVYAKGKPSGGGDTTAPRSAITDPANGAAIPAALWSYSVKGRADDGKNGSGVQYVEVSTDGGSNWSRARDLSSDGSWTVWSYRWPLDFSGQFTLKSRAADKAGNVENPRKGVTVTVTR